MFAVRNTVVERETLGGGCGRAQTRRLYEGGNAWRWEDAEHKMSFGVVMMIRWCFFDEDWRRCVMICDDLGGWLGPGTMGVAVSTREIQRELRRRMSYDASRWWVLRICDGFWWTVRLCDDGWGWCGDAFWWRLAMMRDDLHASCCGFRQKNNIKKKSLRFEVPRPRCAGDNVRLLGSRYFHQKQIFSKHTEVGKVAENVKTIHNKKYGFRRHIFQKLSRSTQSIKTTVSTHDGWWMMDDGW